MKRIFSFFGLLLLVLMNGQTQAQNGGYTGSFADIGFSPIAMSMGNAISSVPELGDFSFYNPALAAIGLRGVEMGSSLMTFDRRMDMAQVQLRIPPAAGLSFSVLHAGISNIDGRSLSGYPNGTFSANDYLFLTSFGVQVSSSFFMGASIKYAVADYYEEVPSASSFGLDIGFLYKSSAETFYSLTIRNLIMMQQWNTNSIYGENNNINHSSQYPLRVGLGVSHRLLENKLLLSGELISRVYFSELWVRRIENDFNPPTEQLKRKPVTTLHTSAQFGVAYLIHERLRILAGFSQRELEYSGSESFSAGFVLYLPFDAYQPSINYNIQSEPNVGTFIHSVSFRFRF